MRTPNLSLLCALLGAGLTFLVLPAHAQLLPTDAGTIVNGYEDDFDGGSLNPNWVVRGQDVYSVSGGMLHVASASGDPNHLLYELGGYNNSIQEVLARIRVTNFGTGDPSRLGISTVVDPSNSQGINLFFRDEPNPGQRHIEFLDDIRSWGTEFPANWQNNTWYWLRVRHEPNAASQGGVNDVFGKIWLADGTQAEPGVWQTTYDYVPLRGARTGFAGIGAGSSSGTAEYDVDYILIKASGLPSIVVAPNSFVQRPVTITNQPQSQTVVEGDSVTFTVGSTGNPPPTFQWHRNDSPIAGATNSTHVSGMVRLADAGAVFKVVAQNVVSNTTSSNATLSVQPDDGPPVLRAVHALGLSQVQVIFSERVTEATATNAGNYVLTNSGGSIPISSAVLDASQSNVVLNVGAMTQGATYTLMVNRIADTSSAGNIIAPNTSTNFTAVSYTPATIGNPQPAGGTVAVTGGLNVTAGGRDIGGTSDQFLFNYQTRTGDFDVKVRIDSLSLADAWSEAGLLAREDLNPGSRFASVIATPSISGTYFQSRSATNGNTTLAGSFPVNYPNTWLRLQRVGNQFAGYTGWDGQSWNPLGAVSIAMPATINLGLAVSSHNTNRTTTAAFRDFANVSSATTNTAPLPVEPLGQSSRRTSLVISEIMYHPADRADGRRLEFVEIFNSLATPEEISGWRLDGDADFTFPSNTVIPGGGFLVVAQAPADVQAVYGITGALGPFSNTNSLPNTRGTVLLRNRIGAVFLEANYDSEAPWPAAADGAGHSLVLARPSYGEGNAAAWAASDMVGGSPGRLDPVTIDPLRDLVINEFLAHTDEPELDFIELYNHGNQTVDISGCYLTDARNTNKFTIPSGVTLQPRGFITFNQNQLGFALSSGGETIYLRNPANTRVLDAVGFEAQASGISSGRYPDGAPGFVELAAKTPGTTNSPFLIRDIVINELMYHPISGDNDDEFIELHNRGGSAVNLGGWRITGGISFTLPSTAVIPANGYVTIARDAARLISHYPNLNANNTWGDYDGSLANGGERVALAMPAPLVTTNNNVVTTNFNYIVVDEVTYRDGGRWGQWSDGGGGSLELIDTRSDNRLAANWADSDETAKAPWTAVSVSGVLDNGTSPADQLQVLLQGAGEALIDNVEVFSQVGGHLIANSTFESNATGWTAEGTQAQSSHETSQGFNSARSYHVRATDRGDNQINRIRTPLAAVQASGGVVTIRAQVRWLRGHPEILFRLRGNWHEAAVRMDLPTNLGTPGARNSRAVNNAGPAIYDVVHHPIVPGTNQPVVVTARVHDPDGLASIQLRYRIDPSASMATLAMVDNGTGGDSVAGDGLFSATIPGQAVNALVAFHVQATDQFSPAASASFPGNAPARECLVRFGETIPPGNFPAYRFWMTQAAFNAWDVRHNLDNTLNDVTFALGNHRVIYNAGGAYAGSPYIAPGFTTPTGQRCGYTIEFPEDEPFLGDNALVLDWPGGHGNENTGIQEQMAYWITDQMDLPFSHRYFIRLTINGVTDMQRGTVFEGVLQPGGDYLEQWSPGNSEGDFFKIDRAFEFDNGGSRIADPEPQLRVYATPDLLNGGTKKKTEKYRWYWLGRSFESANDYTNLFVLADVLNSTAPEPYTSQTEALADVEQWMGIFAVEHIINNFDSWGHDIGKNMYMFKPEGGRWQIYMFDLDWLMLVAAGNYPPTSGPLFISDDPTVTRMYNHPPFRRAYFRAVQNAISNAFVTAKYEPVMDAKYSSLVANGITMIDGQTLAAPTAVKTWFSQRRAFLSNQLNTVTASFSINSSVAITGNVATISGTAPIAVESLVINSNAWPVRWTTVTNWTVRLPVSMVTNQLTVLGLDVRGSVVPGASNQITVINNNALAPAAEGFVLFNEVMHSPSLPDAEYVELYNSSTNFTFDLSGWQVNGLDYIFPAGSFIGPRSFLVLAKSRSAFGAAYGGVIPVFDEFGGNLHGNGETLTLIRPGATADVDAIIDKLRYESQPAWNTNANFTGSSLQLVDPLQDNSRAGNWISSFVPSVFFPATTNSDWRFVSVTGTAGPVNRLLVYLVEGGTLFIDDIYLCLGNVAETGSNFVRNGDFEAPLIDNPPLTNSWEISTNNLNTEISSTVKHRGNSSLRVVGGTTSTGVTNRSISQMLSPAPAEGQQCTLSFWFLPTYSATNIGVRLQGSGSPTAVARVTPPVTLATNTPLALSRSPGAANTLRTNLPAFPPLWLNEVQVQNVTGIQDASLEREPWVELYNAGSEMIPLTGLYLAAVYTNLTEWAFPAGSTIAPGEFKVIFADGESAESTLSELHTSFRLAASNGSVALARIANGQPQVIDYLNYTTGPDRSYGAFPDGQPFHRQELFYATPRGTNDGRSERLVVYINEWMAANTQTIRDPADDDYDDWIELFNASTTAADISGLYLSDDLTNKFKFRLPPGTTIPARRFLLIWADEEGASIQSVLHANFQLSRNGEMIGLYRSDGTVLDQVSFGPQTNDVSQGRFADGQANLIFMTTPTPGAPNLITLLPPNIFRQPSPQTVVERGTASFRLGTTGSRPQTYRWMFGSAFLPDATNSTLTISNVLMSQAGDYSVLVANSSGSQLSASARLVVLRDTDADGIPDDFETAHALNPNDSADGALDPDLDGMDNLQEYLNGTDRLLFEIFLKALSSSEGIIEFRTGPNRSYSVQMRENWSFSQWETILDLSAAPTNRVIRLTNSIDGQSARFFRAFSP